MIGDMWYAICECERLCQKYIKYSLNFEVEEVYKSFAKAHLIHSKNMYNVLMTNWDIDLDFFARKLAAVEHKYGSLL